VFAARPLARPARGESRHHSDPIRVVAYETEAQWRQAAYLAGCCQLAQPVEWEHTVAIGECDGRVVVLMGHTRCSEVGVIAQDMPRKVAQRIAASKGRWPNP